MPMYEYSCRVCGHRFEEMRVARQRHEPAACPECDADGAVLTRSAPGMVGVAANGSHANADSRPPAGGCCGGGMCGL